VVEDFHYSDEDPHQSKKSEPDPDPHHSETRIRNNCGVIEKLLNGLPCPARGLPAPAFEHQAQHQGIPHI
jgi:hypothetical protein